MDNFFPFVTDGQVTKISLTDGVPSQALVDEFTQYEWIEADKKWSTIFDGDPDPPSNLSPGKFDGQIIDVKNE